MTLETFLGLALFIAIGYGVYRFIQYREANKTLKGGGKRGGGTGKGTHHK